MYLTLSLFAALLFAPQDGAKPASASAPALAADADAAVVREQLPSYPLATCPVSGEALDSMGGPLDVVRDGRLVRLCCKGCVKGLDKDPAAVIAKIDAAVIKAQLAGYPMLDCPVSGEKLGTMGDPVDVVHGTRLVRLCCKGCLKEFKKDPAPTMAALDAAYIEALRPEYALKTCVVSGEALGSMGDPIDVLYGVRLVRFCCKGCVKAFDKNPAEFVAALDAAAKAADKGKADKGKDGGKGQ